MQNDPFSPGLRGGKKKREKTDERSSRARTGEGTHSASFDHRLFSKFIIFYLIFVCVFAFSACFVVVVFL